MLFPGFFFLVMVEKSFDIAFDSHLYQKLLGGNSFVLNGAISACKSAQEWQPALVLLREAQAQETIGKNISAQKVGSNKTQKIQTTNIYIYTYMYSVYIFWEQHLACLGKQRQTNSNISESSSGLSPSSRSKSRLRLSAMSIASAVRSVRSVSCQTHGRGIGPCSCCKRCRSGMHSVACGQQSEMKSVAPKAVVVLGQKHLVQSCILQVLKYLFHLICPGFLPF